MISYREIKKIFLISDYLTNMSAFINAKVNTIESIQF